MYVMAIYGHFSTHNIITCICATSLFLLKTWRIMKATSTLLQGQSGKDLEAALFMQISPPCHLPVLSVFFVSVHCCFVSLQVCVCALIKSLCKRCSASMVLFTRGNYLDYTSDLAFSLYPDSSSVYETGPTCSRPYAVSACTASLF